MRVSKCVQWERIGLTDLATRLRERPTRCVAYLLANRVVDSQDTPIPTRLADGNTGRNVAAMGRATRAALRPLTHPEAAIAAKETEGMKLRIC